MSHFTGTSSRPVRKVAPYQPPTLFGMDEPAPRRPSPSQPGPMLPPTPPDAAPLILVIEGRPYRARVEYLDSRHRPTLHVIDLEQTRDRRDRCRVAYHPDDGLIGTCDGWTAEDGCVHGIACYDAGLFPELDTACVMLAEGGAS